MWENDLARGRNVEQLIKTELAQHFRYVGNGDNTSYCDLWAYETMPVLIEIKDESRYQHSPNIIVEMFSRKKPSCILTTAASVQLHYFSDSRIVIFNIAKLRWFCSCWYLLKKMPEGVGYIQYGNSDGAEGFIIAVEVLTELGQGWTEVITLDNLHASYVWGYR